MILAQHGIIASSVASNFSLLSILTDGVDERVRATHGSKFNFLQPNLSWSVSMWVKPLVLGNGFFFSYDLSASFVSVSIGTTGGGLLTADMYDDLNLLNTTVEGDTVLSVGNWYHVVLTNDGSNTAAGMKLYVDSSLETNAVMSDNTLDTTLSTTTIEFGYGLGSYFNGYIDDISIYDAELNGAAITDIYNGGKPKNESARSNLKGYWTFDNGSFGANWTFTDLSASPVNATSINMEVGDRVTDVPL